MTALRPHLTQSLLRNLQQGHSLNLIGSVGQGRERLLADLRTAAQSEDALVLYADMRRYARSFNALLLALWAQCPPADTGAKKPKNMADVFKVLDAQRQSVWLLLHQFDALHANATADPLYNLDFLNHLNSLRNKSGNALLVMTEKLHINKILLTHNKQNSTSPLDMDHQWLSPLSTSEIQAQLQRELPDATENDIAILANAAQDHPASYDFARHLQALWSAHADTDVVMTVRLQQWRKDFDQRERQGTTVLYRAWRLDQWLQGWSVVLVGPVQRLAKISVLLQAIKKWKLWRNSDK